MEVRDKVIKKEFQDKLITIAEWRKNYAGGISSQAVDYAISRDLIDYIEIGPRVRAIVLTEKTLAYIPNKSPSRNTTMGL